MTAVAAPVIDVSKPPAASSRRGDWGVTFSGRRFFPFDPRPEDIDPIDVAHHLALCNRWAGATSAPFSVAQHSVLVSYHCRPEHALIGLLHDAAEAYIHDISRPFKKGLPVYGSIERAWNVAIAQALGLADHELVTLPLDVQIADKEVCEAEARDLVAKHPRSMSGVLKDRVEPWHWKVAEDTFLKRYRELAGSR